MSIEQLVHWATFNGAIIDPHVSFEKNEHGISGRYNSEPVHSDKSDSNKCESDSLIGIPVSLAMTPKTAVESLGNFGSSLYEKSSNINSVLKFYLCLERTSAKINKSFYKPYISLLPSLQDINSPYTWNEEEKKFLKGTNLGNSLNENIAQLVEEWWYAINLIDPEQLDLKTPEQHFVNMKFYYEYKFYTDNDMHEYLNTCDLDNWTSFPNFLWASLILKSRSFPYYLFQDYVTDPIKPDEAMLLPLIDLLNHSMKAKVNWSVEKNKKKEGIPYFCFTSESVVENSELFNNYGMKGNEELLLAYGFCIEDNVADSAALKIKVPIDFLPELEKQGVKLPQLNDYTTSVVRQAIPEQSTSSTVDYKKFEDGLLFFITVDNVPENLIKLFQCLVRNTWEESQKSTITLRMKLAGLNQLRQAIESKSDILSNIKLPATSTSRNIATISIYLQSQRKIFNGAIKTIKRLEKKILTDPKSKNNLITLKSVYKKDKKFQQALLICLGISSYEQILDSEFQDQFWLLYLIRCYNRNEYINIEDEENVDEDGDDENYLPEWIYKEFCKISSESSGNTPAEIMQYKDLYLGLIPQLAQAAPEVFGRGKWRVDELIYSAKLLELISFVRGKEQECILVEQLYN